MPAPRSTRLRSDKYAANILKRGQVSTGSVVVSSITRAAPRAKREPLSRYVWFVAPAEARDQVEPRPDGHWLFPVRRRRIWREHLASTPLVALVRQNFRIALQSRDARVVLRPSFYTNRIIFR